jgi:hypothetical protein
MTADDILHRKSRFLFLQNPDDLFLRKALLHLEFSFALVWKTHSKNATVFGEKVSTTAIEQEHLP